ncbi:MAG: nucleotidyltransferase domain-containing protein, partial [Symploca sp. SIO1B1]|nr:nucleotidyltransferase domain-containing protein [Symploca sp. SIO1B1]NES00869.1 nucleotidyltransferase domain-containing protein [Symploca sp. SIO1B1]
MALNIVNDELEIILTELRSQLANYYGARLKKIIMFGSQARGDA